LVPGDRLKDRKRRKDGKAEKENGDKKFVFHNQRKKNKKRQTGGEKMISGETFSYRWERSESHPCKK